jgi:hypothetical protein
MGSSTGPIGVAKDAVLFHYDTGETFFSFKGEPTTNLIPSPGLNSLPTYGNGWATYNTNQYCGNNGCAVHWDIPAIASVSSNIITTVSAHQIRSFDVITPLTTGGGVTGGANYLAKKISDTQFSLHEWNSSQDGSQGYINTATGGFKVHDSYWLDQRVSVNASSFPTKWWGSPHLPNSGIVKEIIPGGFTVRGNTKTDCVRLHWFRPDGVTDGMAYGPDASITIGQPVSTSFYLRAASSNAVGQYIAFQHYNYGGPGGASGYYLNAYTGALGEWVKCSFTFTPTHNTVISYWFPSTGNMKIDLANIQVEQKNHATQFIAGSRTATQGLLDLKGNSSIDLSSVSFDTNAQMVFDGTDDLIDITTNLGTLSAYTFEYVALANSADNMPISSRTSTAFYKYGANSWRYTHGGTAAEFYHTAGLATGWAHWVISYNGSTISIYENNVFKGSVASTGTADFTGGIRIGSWASSAAYTWDGQIPVVKMYNRGLTAAEVSTQYRSYKTRFNLP